MKNTRKGFTLVELLVVIAMLAILATVTVIGLTGCIEEAKLSADQQVAEQMNTALEAGAVLAKPENFGDALTLLTDNGFVLKNFETTASGYSYYWHKETNQMVLYNADKGELAYPADLATSFKVEDAVSVNDILSKEALVGGTSYDSIEDAIAAAPAGATIHILNEATFDTALSVTKNLTINGHGNTILTSGSRGINVVDSDISLEINDLIVSVEGNVGGGRALQVNSGVKNVTIVANNSTFIAESYTIHLMHDVENANVTLNNCFSYGYTALYVKCFNSNITVNNSTLSSNNNVSPAPSNSFATIVIQGSYADGTEPVNGMGANNTIVIKNSKIEADKDANVQCWIEASYEATGNVVTITDTEIVREDGSYINGDNTVTVDGVVEPLYVGE